MSILLRSDSVNFLSQHGTVHRGDRLLILSGGHRIRKLIDILLVYGKMSFVEAPSSHSFALRQALKEKITKFTI